MQILYSYYDFNRTTEIKRYIDGSNDEVLLDNVQYDTESLLDCSRGEFDMMKVEEKHFKIFFSFILWTVLVCTALCIEQTFVVRERMDPYGTGLQEIRIVTRNQINGKIGEVEYYDEDDNEVGYELYDNEGQLSVGWKWEGGVYYVWVLNDPDDPSKYGKWVESEPPEEEKRESIFEAMGNIGERSVVRIIIAVFLLLVCIILAYMVLKKKKDGTYQESDYRISLIVGLVYCLAGLGIFVLRSFSGHVVLIISLINFAVGLCYIALGLVNKKKWKT